jgi:hypothetical protein
MSDSYDGPRFVAILVPRGDPHPYQFIGKRMMTVPERLDVEDWMICRMGFDDFDKSRWVMAGGRMCIRDEQDAFDFKMRWC